MPKKLGGSSKRSDILVIYKKKGKKLQLTLAQSIHSTLGSLILISIY